ncbi:hypothetical protein BGZ54_002027, partial [Gamsiella multidivaricata]
TDAPQYVTGLVNVGNTCFMNAVLQALASLPSLRAYLEARKDIGHAQDSITLALCETVEMLNTMHRRPTAKRLVRMVSTVKAKAAHVLTSQQQDAQELFQILSSQISEEREKLDHPGTASLLDRTAVSDILNPPPSLPRRLSSSSVMSSSLSFSQLQVPKRDGNASPSSEPSSPSSHCADAKEETSAKKEKGEPMAMTASLIMDRNEQEKFSRAKSPFMGLLASRVSCVDCGYTYSCSLEDCLESFIHLDTITDFNCRKCTVLKASKDLERMIEQGRKPLAGDEARQRESQTGSTAPQENAGATNNHPAESQPENSGSSRRRSSNGVNGAGNKKSATSRISLEEMEKMKERVDQCLAYDIEMDLSPLELTPVRSNRTTKHSMIAKPPQALCLHLNRSMFTPSGQMTKNPCKVLFGPRLDFTQFTTSGHLTTVATKSMSRRGSVSGPGATSTAGLGSEKGIATVPTSAGAPASLFSRRESNGCIPLSSPWTAHTGSGLIARSTLGVGNGHGEIAGKDDGGDDRVVYRLWAVIVHFGSHNSGHFVTYRRIPSSSTFSSSDSSAALRRRRRKDGVEERQVGDMDDLNVADSEKLTQPSVPMVTTEDKWWRISDEDVQIVDWVRNAEAYMLFFEKEA